VLTRWRHSFAEDSIFRKPLVLEISVVLITKILLLIVLWHLAFKPLKPAEAPDINKQLLSNNPLTINTKEIKHD
jgi:hypothetical protein